MVSLFENFIFESIPKHAMKVRPFQKFKYRSKEEEIIDDFSMGGEEVVRTFKTIERVNTLLGGNSVLVKGVQQIVQQLNLQEEPIHLYDLGCGSGDGLRSIARWARKKNIPITLIGVDANPFIVDHARQQSANFPEISFIQQDIFQKECSLKKADIVAFNLCLHHFTEEEQAILLQKCKDDKVKAILINDLHRHWLAYYSFTVFCWLTGANKMAREDGRLSILKGFKREELKLLGKNSGVLHPLVRWRWAFRYEMSLYY